ncbi:uncharacterized protein PAC_16014 [Phialocephala subalpina]|uniref:Uncharacterized protein n=1 Tax=Phialocephala subalpina TaxID=576137 RepID=A0A1L7XM63_9HELO|nr:uncharacterized protein PAC_16014 [Phialocephala subalpina]
MSSNQPSSTSSSTYESVLASLLPPKSPHVFLTLPISPHKPLIPSHLITTLSLHPVLESFLHILNLDLSSAHFLLRHMQAAPAFEAMYLHGILHRIEGDVDNARAWYRDVKETDVFRAAWEEGGLERAMDFMGKVEGVKGIVRGGKLNGGDGEVDEVREESLMELKAVLGFCEIFFGTGKVEDASGVWVSMSEKNKDIAEKMIAGGEGWRRF